MNEWLCEDGAVCLRRQVAWSRVEKMTWTSHLCSNGTHQRNTKLLVILLKSLSIERDSSNGGWAVPFSSPAHSAPITRNFTSAPNSIGWANRSSRRQFQQQQSRPYATQHSRRRRRQNSGKREIETKMKPYWLFAVVKMPARLIPNGLLSCYPRNVTSVSSIPFRRYQNVCHFMSSA